MTLRPRLLRQAEAHATRKTGIRYPAVKIPDPRAVVRWVSVYVYVFASVCVGTRACVLSCMQDGCDCVMARVRLCMHATGLHLRAHVQ